MTSTCCLEIQALRQVLGESFGKDLGSLVTEYARGHDLVAKDPMKVLSAEGQNPVSTWAAFDELELSREKITKWEWGTSALTKVYGNLTLELRGTVKMQSGFLRITTTRLDLRGARWIYEMAAPENPSQLVAVLLEHGSDEVRSILCPKYLNCHTSKSTR